MWAEVLYLIVWLRKRKKSAWRAPPSNCRLAGSWCFTPPRRRRPREPPTPPPPPPPPAAERAGPPRVCVCYLSRTDKAIEKFIVLTCTAGYRTRFLRRTGTFSRYFFSSFRVTGCLAAWIYGFEKEKQFFFFCFRQKNHS